MPAVSSSPIAVLSRHLGPLGEVGPQERGGLLEVLESVPDPRRKRGVRHRFSAILFVSVCAVVSGARSFAAIAEWAADAVEDTLCGMGIGAPNASTIRRALSALSGDGFDTAIGGFLAGRLAATRTKAARTKAGTRARRRAIAVDGKALRGSRAGDGRARMLMACLDHAAGVTLGQVEIGEKTNEVRREVPCRISYSVRRNSEQGSWIRRLTRIPKSEGDQSMPVQTWWSCPRVGAVRQGDPRIWRTLDCVKPNLQRCKFSSIGRGRVKPVPRCVWVYFVGPCNLRNVGRCPVRALKEMSGAPKSR